ncbi:MAG TPA: hypothetical protein DEW46_15870 [Verrucomicrobia bacterium]|nr:hypothetical protein [Verrucomicrobiota bacterium]
MLVESFNIFYLPPQLEVQTSFGRKIDTMGGRLKVRHQQTATPINLAQQFDIIGPAPMCLFLPDPIRFDGGDQLWITKVTQRS